MEIKGAVFDLDGTLLDSTGMWDELDGIYLRSMGKEPLEGLSERLHPLTLIQAAELIKTEYRLSQTPEEILTSILSLAEDFYRYEARLKSGAAELLERLCAAGIPMCVCTANTVELTKASLERLGVWRYFRGCVTCSEYGGKDSDKIFRAAAEMLGTTPEQTIVFEDSLHALTTAKYAGYITAAVFDRAESRQEQLRAAADFYLNELGEFVL